MSDDFVKKELTPLEESIGRDDEMKRAFLEEAGLEDVDAKKLRETLLSSEEAIVARQEQQDKVRARKSRKTDWDEFVDAPRRWGRPMHHSEFIQHLRRLIPGLYVTDGVQKDRLGLYIWDRNEPFEGKTGGTVFLGWLHRGWNPEYEIDIVDDVGVAISQKRGWRTLLLRMILRRDAKTFIPKSLFSEEDALREFGPPSNGPTASNYRMQLWQFRNTSPEQAKLEHELMQFAQKYNYHG